MKRLIISEIIKSSVATTTDQGRLVRASITQYMEGSKSITLDFTGIMVASTAFFNAAIGKLYREFNSLVIEEKLKLENISNEELEVALIVKDRAVKYYQNRDAYVNNMLEIIDEDSHE